MTWLDSTMLFLMISQFGGVIKLLYLAGEQTAELRGVKRRLTFLEANHAGFNYRDHSPDRN